MRQLLFYKWYFLFLKTLSHFRVFFSFKLSMLYQKKSATYLASIFMGYIILSLTIHSHPKIMGLGFGFRFHTQQKQLKIVYETQNPKYTILRCTLNKNYIRSFLFKIE